MNALGIMIVIISLTIHNGGMEEHIGIIVPEGTVPCQVLLEDMLQDESETHAGISGRCAVYEEVGL